MRLDCFQLGTELLVAHLLLGFAAFINNLLDLLIGSSSVNRALKYAANDARFSILCFFTGTKYRGAFAFRGLSEGND